MTEYLILLFFAVFVNNCVFQQTYGICPFLGVSRKSGDALGMGVAVTFVMLSATAVTFPIRQYVLAPLGLEYLETIVFILVIAVLVQLIEMALKKYIPALHRALGVYLPLITTNCAVLGVTVDSINAGYSFGAAVFSAAGSGIGFLLAMLLFSGVRARLSATHIPASWKGLPITLAAAAIVTLSFGGFVGLIAVPDADAAPHLYHIAAERLDAFTDTPLKMAVFAVVLLFVLGILLSFLLVLAARFLTVESDGRLEGLRSCLPGVNCGACGYTGCDGYAKALLEDKSLPTNLCVPGGDAVSRALSDALGREFLDVCQVVASVACDGRCGVSPAHNRYNGIESCAAAKLFYGGPAACSFGCIGYGDCAAACPQDAICIVDDVARVDTRACIGCGLCRDACPQGLIHLLPDTVRIAVLCSSSNTAAETRKLCKNGCIGCRKCEKVCETGAIKVKDNLATIDYSLCNGCLACAEACPTGAVVPKDHTGYHRNDSRL